MQPNTLSRGEHPVSRSNISKNALKVLYRLHEAGFASYLVGGGVRDLLLGKLPKDFDIATDASPEQVKELFDNCRLIGRRFRLAHVIFGRDIIEVATFRAAHTEGTGGMVGDTGRIVRDNVFGGTLADDAIRRDLTINALYYNIADFSVVDFFGGVEDLGLKKIRFIGSAAERITEDPVRSLRAVRFAAKLDFDLDNDVEQAITEHSSSLADIPPARLFEEVLKLLQSGHGTESFEQLCRHNLLQYLFPMTAVRLQNKDEYLERLIGIALRNTDSRIQNEQPVTPAFIYAVMLWSDVVAAAARHEQQGMPPVPAMFAAADEVVPGQLAATALPRRFSMPMREIWALQPRLYKTRGKRAMRLLGNPRFRAAYDFLCLRSEAGEELDSFCVAWEKMQELPEGQELLLSAKSRARQSRTQRRPRNNGRSSDKKSAG